MSRRKWKQNPNWIEKYSKLEKCTSKLMFVMLFVNEFNSKYVNSNYSIRKLNIKWRKTSNWATVNRLWGNVRVVVCCASLTHSPHCMFWWDFWMNENEWTKELEEKYARSMTNGNGMMLRRSELNYLFARFCRKFSGRLISWLTETICMELNRIKSI